MDHHNRPRGNSSKVRRMQLALVALLVLLFSISAVHADIVFMRNGKRIRGTIVQQDRRFIQIRTGGRVLRISKRKIKRVRFIDEAALRKKQIEIRRQREEALRKKQAAEKKRKEEEFKRKQKEELKKQEEALKNKEVAERKRLEKELKRKQLEELRRRIEDLKDKQRKERERQEALIRQKQREARRRAEEAGDPPSRWSALWRSAILPGWGQYYQRRNSMAKYYLYGFAGTSFLTLVAVNDYRSKRSVYDDSASSGFNISPVMLGVLGVATPAGSVDILQLASMGGTSDGRARMEKSGNRANRLATILFGLYVVNLADVTFWGHTEAKKRHDSRRSAYYKPEIGLALGPNYKGFQLSFRF